MLGELGNRLRSDEQRVFTHRLLFPRAESLQQLESLQALPLPRPPHQLAIVDPETDSAAAGTESKAATVAELLHSLTIKPFNPLCNEEVKCPDCTEPVLTQPAIAANRRSEPAGAANYHCGRGAADAQTVRG